MPPTLRSLLAPLQRSLASKAAQPPASANTWPGTAGVGGGSAGTQSGDGLSVELSSASALRTRLEREDTQAMRALTRSAVVVLPLVQFYMLACWLLGWLPGTQVLIYVGLSLGVFFAMLPLALATDRQPVLRAWVSMAWVCLGYVVCVPAMLQMSEFAARALLMAVALLTMLLVILRQTAAQQLLCGSFALILYAFVEIRVQGTRLYNEEVISYLLVMTGMAGAVIQIGYLGSQVHRIRQALDSVSQSLAATVERMEHRALHDATTGLPNRLNLTRVLQRLLEPAQAAPDDAPLSICLFEPGDLRRFNERLGETAGDDILRRIARAAGEVAARQAGPATFHIGRFGGPRFMLVMPRTASVQARQVATQLRDALARIDLSDLMPGMSVGAAFGIATTPVPMLPAFTAQDLIAAASTALQRARHDGVQGIREADPARHTRERAHDATTQPADAPGPDSTWPAPTPADSDASAADGRLAIRSSAARIGESNLPWPSPFFFVLSLALLMDLGYVALCWSMGMLSTAVAAPVGAAATMLIALGWRRATRRKERGARARFAWRAILWSVPAVVLTTIQVDDIGGRIGLAILNGAPIASGILFLDRRRFMQLGALVCGCWVVVLVTRPALGIAPTVTTDVMLGVVCSTYAILLALVGGHVYSIRARIANYTHALRSLMRQMSELALLDDMTGLPNRRGIHQQLHAQVVLAERQRTPLSICVAEVRDDERAQESWSAVQVEHRARQVAQALRSCTQPGDIVGRLGHGRFLLVFPGSDLASAQARVQCMRARLEQVQAAATPTSVVTAMFGVAQWAVGERVGSLLQRAERGAVRLRVGERDARVQPG